MINFLLSFIFLSDMQQGLLGNRYVNVVQCQVSICVKTIHARQRALGPIILVTLWHKVTISSSGNDKPNNQSNCGNCGWQVLRKIKRDLVVFVEVVPTSFFTLNVPVWVKVLLLLGIKKKHSNPTGLFETYHKVSMTVYLSL